MPLNQRLHCLHNMELVECFEVLVQRGLANDVQVSGRDVFLCDAVENPGGKDISDLELLVAEGVVVSQWDGGECSLCSVAR